MGFGNLGLPAVRDNYYRYPDFRYNDSNYRMLGDKLGIFGNQFFENTVNPLNKFGGPKVLDNNPLKGIVTGSNKGAVDEIPPDGRSGYEKWFGQSPQDTVDMYSKMAEDAGDYQLKNRLKLGMLDDLRSLGTNLGLGGAQYIYQGALADAKNSAYVTVNSKLNPQLARRDLRATRSYFT